MDEQLKELINIHKKFINVFNNWEYSKNDNIDFKDMTDLIQIYNTMNDLLKRHNKIKIEYKKIEYLDKGGK